MSPAPRLTAAPQPPLSPSLPHSLPHSASAPKVARKSAILDSGTNVLLVPSPIFAAMTETFEGLCQQGAKLKGVCGVRACMCVCARARACV